MFATQREVSSLTALAIIVAFTVGVFGGAFFYKSLEMKQADVILSGALPAITVVKPPTPSPVADPATASWLTYRNEQYGYEIKFPSDFKQIDWSGYPQAELIADFQGKLNGIEARLNVRVINEKKYSSLGQFLQEVNEIQAQAYEGQPSVQVNKESKLSVAGQEAVQREQDLLAANFPDVSTHIFKGGSVITISTNGNSDKVALLLFHNQVLSTFRFIK